MVVVGPCLAYPRDVIPRNTDVIFDLFFGPIGNPEGSPVAKFDESVANKHQKNYPPGRGGSRGEP